jgi:site-specific DNA recombinase
MRAVGYIRVSTEEQAREGLSLEAQRERIEAYCKLQGLQLREVFADQGVSGSIPLLERPGGAKLLEAITAGQAEHVVALKLDRLFRDAGDALTTLKEWDNHGIALHLLDLGGSAFNSKSAMGKFFLTMTAAFAELERNLISERTKTALAYKRSQGAWLGNVPFGFKLEGGRLIEDPEQLMMIERVKAMRRSHRSFREIARELGISVATAHRLAKTPLGKRKERYLRFTEARL